MKRKDLLATRPFNTLLLMLFFLFLPALLPIAGCGEERAVAPTPSITASPAAGRRSPSPAVTSVKQSTQSPSAVNSPASAEWTILFYFGADCDLEDAMLDNLKQILSVGGSSNVHVLILADRSPDGDKENGYTNRGLANLKNWKTAKVLYVEKGTLKELADWGILNLGDGKTLTRFLEYGMKIYPARKTALLFSDHGAAWNGVSADENPESSILSLMAIRSSLKKVTARFGRLELIGFDACLMGNLEVAHAVAPYARYMVASEELEPGYGWYFTPVMKSLVREPTMKGEALGKIIVNSFRDFFMKSDDEDLQQTGESITLAVIALDKVDGVCRAVNTLARALQDSLKDRSTASWKKISRARSRTEEYGTDSNPMDSSFVLDLSQFATLLGRNFKGSPVGTASDELLGALNQAIPYTIRGEARPHASGISIFFPPNRKAWKASEGYGKIPFARDVGWASFIDDYVKKAKKSTPKKAAVKSTGKSVEKKKGVTVTSSVDLEDYDKAYFMLARQMGKKQIIVGQLPAKADKKGNLREEWDGRWFTIEDREQSLVCPVTAYEVVDETKGRYLVLVPAKVRLRTSRRWLDVTMRFDYREKGKDRSGRLLSLVQDTRFGPREINLRNVSEIRPVYLIRDEDGTERMTSSEEKEDILNIDAPSSLKVGWERVPAGMYLAGFRIDSLSGESTRDCLKIKVK